MKTMGTDTATAEKQYRLTNTALMIDLGLSKAEWLAIGRKISSLREATAWAIGDWLVYGKGRGEYGDAYALAQEATGRSYESLSQYARVSAAYDFDERMATLSWSHHREALRITKSRRWDSLRGAREKGWTRHEYAAHVSRVTETRVLAATESSAPKSERWRKQFRKQLTICPACGHSFDRRNPLGTVEASLTCVSGGPIPGDGRTREERREKPYAR